jgi:hypothetical protein
VQRKYYSINGEFSAFALCCALRVSHEREMEEKKHQQMLSKWWLTFRLQRSFRGLMRRHATRFRVMLFRAAKVVQKPLRRYLALKHTRVVLARVRAARRCQALVRRRIARRHEAAARIQRGYWWSRPRRAVRRLLLHAMATALRRVVTWHLERLERATRLQAAYRRHAQFEWYRQYKAARAVQRMARGRLARQELKRLKRELRLSVARRWLQDVLFPAAVAAAAPRVLALRVRMASRVQSNVRRWLLWKKVLLRRMRNERARDVQRARHGMLGRRRFHHLRRRARFSKTNAYRACKSVGAVLQAYAAHTAWLYDPLDARVGEGLGRYVWV